MQESSALHNTFVLERSYPKTTKTVFSAFADEGKKRRWYAEAENNDIQHFEMDFRIGGTERFQYKLKPGTPVAGMIVTNEGRYLDIVSDNLIVSATTMDLGEKRILVSLVTAEFLESDSGTHLILTHQGVYLSGPNGLTPRMIETGWKVLLESLQTHLAH